METGYYYSNGYIRPIMSFTTKLDKKVNIKKYIINNGATIIFWDDDTKTVSKRHKDDAFDKELGFLFAYYYKQCGLSNASRKRVINSIDYSHIKTFLFEMFVKYSGKTPEQARSYLKNLKSDYVPKTTSIKVTSEKFAINTAFDNYKTDFEKAIADLNKRIDAMELDK